MSQFLNGSHRDRNDTLALLNGRQGKEGQTTAVWGDFTTMLRRLGNKERQTRRTAIIKMAQKFEREGVRPDLPDIIEFLHAMSGRNEDAKRLSDALDAAVDNALDAFRPKDAQISELSRRRQIFGLLEGINPILTTPEGLEIYARGKYEKAKEEIRCFSRDRAALTLVLPEVQKAYDEAVALRFAAHRLALKENKSTHRKGGDLLRRIAEQEGSDFGTQIQ